MLRCVQTNPEIIRVWAWNALCEAELGDSEGSVKVRAIRLFRADYFAKTGCPFPSLMEAKKLIEELMEKNNE